MVEIPKLYREKTIKILDQDVTIRGYRAGDTDYVVTLQRSRNQLMDLMGKLKFFQNLQKRVQKNLDSLSEEEIEAQLLNSINDEKLSPDEIQELKEAKDEIDQLKADIEEASHLLGQRGLKRSFYRNEPEYLEAEQQNRTTEYIDNLPDIEVDPDNLSLVANTMQEIGSPTERLIKAADKGKPKKKNQQSRKK